MEQRYSKEEILAQYLNRAPFGGNVVGVEAAAQVWFGKPAARLTLAEASLLKARLEYARAALGKGDLDLALSQCGDTGEESQGLRERIERARQDRTRRRDRLRMAVRSAITLGIVVFLVLAVAMAGVAWKKLGL